MSLRKNAPYPDKVEESGRILIYEGHDVPRRKASIPKAVDQEMYEENSKLTQNGLSSDSLSVQFLSFLEEVSFSESF